jgi:hypothetical protein
LTVVCDQLGDVGRAHVAGVRYLLSRQREDGCWQDYHRLPVGPSTAWVTAFVAVTLFDAGSPDAYPAAERAVDWLLSIRPRCAGWGFNAATGADADSTAWALLAVRSAGRVLPEPAVSFLRSLRRTDGGFATYPRSDGWGISHPDVTPIALLAMPTAERAALADDVLLFLKRWRDNDGSWPAYWWRGRHYSTYWNRVVISSLGYTNDLPPAEKSPSAGCTRMVKTAFDLAWVLALAVLDRDPAPAVAALARLLMERQNTDGSLPCGADLRVTAPFCFNPWAHPLGKLYEDDQGLITTASAVRALALVLGRTGHIPGCPGQNKAGLQKYQKQ